MVVVADAGMLSEARLERREGRRVLLHRRPRLVKAPYDLADRSSGTPPTGQILELAREIGTGKNARQQRVNYQWRLKRQKRDYRTINAGPLTRPRAGGLP
jgi:hypothetical protein